MIEPTSVIWLAPERAIPKSVTFRRPSGPQSTLCGLMSRWTIPFRCAKPTAARISSVYSIASLIGAGPRPTISSLSERPSRYSIAM